MIYFVHIHALIDAKLKIFIETESDFRGFAKIFMNV